MSGARDGEWNLLGHDSDPVPATAEGLDGIISHYRDIAQAMTDQAALLKRIGDGDVRLLKGQAADAMRKRARESNEALSKVADRYTDVKDALVGYQPELRTARTLTGQALEEAEAANRELGHAEGMPDPVNEDRPEDDPLTDEDRQASSDRTAAIGKAETKIADAKDKSDRALEALRGAAERAAAKIRENWGDDGLHHSWQEALRHRIAKVLKKIVEILGYIGMALAVLAILIPGLGIVTLLGVVVTVLSTIASTILAAWGEGSWLSVIIGVVGIAFIGVGVVATRALKGLQSIKVATRGGGWRDAAVDRLAAVSRLRETLRARLPPNFSRPVPPINFSRPMPAWRLNPLSPAERSLLGSLDRQFHTITQNLNRWDDFIGNTTVKPPFWKFYTKNFWSVEKSRFGDVFVRGSWRGDRVLSVNDITDLKKIDLNIVNLLGGAPAKIPLYAKLGPWAFSFGWITSLWGMAVTPTNFSPNDLRSTFDWWKDADYSGLYSENNVMDDR
ncbi:hypothetical protein [Myceligenerans pegani]|uniref:Uncharacterized protein n=1 Tax=Myceligenerans pegani TaxID=2776917 RepID=A0ABR9N2C1_9MICO|nr:hypothetical protein [Myceligenerans sp. TRM 65318]MBE1877253.1 hypothetical protein [Myceligenerans sp. TRM 65318]MBE3019524.1 hypothetical protein [Myceligenerans sp. TRM 65318]